MERERCTSVITFFCADLLLLELISPVTMFSSIFLLLTKSFFESLNQFHMYSFLLGWYWYQGAESVPDKLVLTEHSLAAVLAESKMCCSGQPVMLVGISMPTPV